MASMSNAEICAATNANCFDGVDDKVSGWQAKMAACNAAAATCVSKKNAEDVVYYKAQALVWAPYAAAGLVLIGGVWWLLARRKKKS